MFLHLFIRDMNRLACVLFGFLSLRHKRSRSSRKAFQKLCCNIMVRFLEHEEFNSIKLKFWAVCPDFFKQSQITLEHFLIALPISIKYDYSRISDLLVSCQLQ